MATRIPLILLLLAATALTGVLSTTLDDTDDDATPLMLPVLTTTLDDTDFDGGEPGQVRRSTPVPVLTDMGNVTSNKMVQSLGKFAVENYNRNQLEKNKAPPTTLLSFSHVISAQEHLVAGTMYYLKIVAEDSHHTRKVFDAEIWKKLFPLNNSLKLISFKPSAH